MSGNEHTQSQPSPLGEPTVHGDNSDYFLFKGVERYLRGGYGVEKTYIFDAASQSLHGARLHEKIVYALNGLYQEPITLGTLAAVSRGRELSDFMSELLTGEPIDPRRHMLDETLVRRGMSGVLRDFPEIQLHGQELSPTSFREEDPCFSYAFSFSGVSFKDFQRSEAWRSFTESDNVSGAIALYRFDNDFPAHAGVVLDNGMVRSRWGQDAVVDHPVGLVPTYYGRVAQFFTRNDVSLT